nr:immunoglobulin light chain junction region [Macaca mulatta]MOV77894.1 immunoglobulin light chain junction region [Macaca mulatta]MOV77996.1 immunoglobulin light chain junction region [Macaca mulatta]MOV78149.1 immunoglobulin light chain junction region [Macaca mulatta]MOV78152.1 immunoglobulin light chain junction region [Macaca mulatta]
CMQYRHIPFTF